MLQIFLKKTLDKKIKQLILSHGHIMDALFIPPPLVPELWKIPHGSG